jgi:hypothetical protein
MPEIVGRLRTPRLASAPATPAVGEMYYNTATNTLYWWNGTSWVSASGGSIDMNYKGAYPTGTPYTDGDIVVGSDGNTYLCVKPTSSAPVAWANVTAAVGPPGPQGPQGAAGIQGPAGAGIPTVQNGKFLNGSGGAAVWAGLDTYSTSLPATPLDGQRAVLVDSVTNPNYQWEFRYNAQSTSSYKWEFIGGPPAYIAVEVTENTTRTTAGDLATPGPSFTIPRAGDYIIELSVRVDKIGGAGWVCTYTVLFINGVQAGPPYTELFNNVYNPGTPAPYSNTSEKVKWTRAAGDVLKMAYQIITQDNAGSTVSFQHRRMTVIPVRVS